MGQPTMRDYCQLTTKYGNALLPELREFDLEPAGDVRSKCCRLQLISVAPQAGGGLYSVPMN
jgi:hypothetical protein